MKRVWIIGASGSGKSTLARQLANKIGASCVDLDELSWRPNWQETPEDEFVESLERALNAPSWIIAGNYTRIQSRFMPRADTIIWLDYSFLFVLWRQIKRTTRRVVRHEPCCNGNFETLTLTFSRESVVLWLLKTYARRRRSGWDTKRLARRRGVRVFHFRHHRNCQKWLETVTRDHRCS